jgi:hypothetical protein
LSAVDALDKGDLGIDRFKDIVNSAETSGNVGVPALPKDPQ